MSSTVTVEGNLTADPRVNVTSTGKAVANLRLAVSSRRKDRKGDYQDTPPVFYDVTVWGPVAENVAASVRAGDREQLPGQRPGRQLPPADLDTGAASNDKNPAADRDREALGRSRGGLTTKIHLAADRRCRPLSRVTTAGQRHDSVVFEQLMAGIRITRVGGVRRGPGPVTCWATRRSPARRSAPTCVDVASGRP